MEGLKVPEIEVKTTKELLESFAGKTSGVGTIIPGPQFNDASAEGDAKRELERRIMVLFNQNYIFKNSNFKFGDFMSHGTANIFIVEVSVDDSNQYGKQLLLTAFKNSFPLNYSISTDENRYRLVFDIRKFEMQLVHNKEPAGIYVNESPLTIDQITDPRLYWVNMQFDEIVKPNIDRAGTVFDKKIEKVDGELRIRAYTAFGGKDGDKLSRYVLENQPLGFYIKYGEKPPEHGVYLHISFEDFKKLLPSTVVDEERAGVSERVNEAVPQK